MLKGLTPTCVNKDSDKFLALVKTLRASSVFAERTYTHTSQ